MTNITALPGVVPKDAPEIGQPDDEMLKLVEAFLADVREGKIKDFAVAMVDQAHATASFYWISKLGKHDLMASIADLDFRFRLDRMNDDDDDDEA